MLAPYGPSLPALLRDRLGVPPRATAAALLAAGALAAVAAAAPSIGGDARATLSRPGPPPFTLTHAPGALRPVAPRAGELARLQGRRGDLSVSVVVRRLGDGRPVSPGALPAEGSRYAGALERATPGFVLREEGKARAHGAPAYRLGYRTRDGFGRALLAVPDDGRPGTGAAVVLHRTRVRGGMGPAQQELFDEAKRVHRSFRFGT